MGRTTEEICRVQASHRQDMMKGLLQDADRVFLQSEAVRMLRNFVAVLSALEFLNGLQRHKTRRGTLSPDQEREALSRAYAGSQCLRTAIGSHLSVSKHLLASGGLERTISAFKGIAATLPDISVADLWKCGTDAYETRALFAEKGVDGWAFRQVDEMARKATYGFRIIGDQLAVSRPDKDAWIPVLVRHANDRATADRIWRPDDVDIVLEAIKHRGPLPVEVFAVYAEPGHTKPLPCDLLTLQAVASARAIVDADSYVCTLEQAGMPVYSGRDPGFWVVIAVIAGVVAAIAVIVTIVCFAIGDYDSDKGFKHKACDAASWLSLIGLGIFLGSLFMGGDPNTTVCVNGTCYRNRNELFPSDPKIE